MIVYEATIPECSTVDNVARVVCDSCLRRGPASLWHTPAEDMALEKGWSVTLIKRPRRPAQRVHYCADCVPRFLPPEVY